MVPSTSLTLDISHVDVNKDLKTSTSFTEVTEGTEVSNRKLDSLCLVYKDLGILDLAYWIPIKYVTERSNMLNILL